MNPGTATDTIYVRVCRSASQTTDADCSSGAQSVAVTAAPAAPTVSSVSPTAMTADGASHTLTIYGGNFQSGNIVQFKWGVPPNSGVWNNGSTPTINSASQMTTSMNPGTATDTIYVRVCRSASQTTTADCSSGAQSVAVTVAPAAPTVSSVSPTAMTADGASHTLTIYGGNFQSGNIVQFKWGVPPNSGVWNNGSTPTINSASQMTTSMNPGTATDTIYVRVCRSASQTTTADCSSGAQSVAVTAAVAAPSISALSPSSYPVSGSNQTMLINGSNFRSGATVTFHDPQGNPYVRTPTFVSSSQLSHQFNDGSDAGTWTVFVTNPNGQTSNTWSFTVH
jgi:hypothetical protein